MLQGEKMSDKEDVEEEEQKEYSPGLFCWKKKEYEQLEFEFDEDLVAPI